MGIPQTAKAYIIQQCNYRGFTHFSNVKKERMVRVIQKFDELEAADDAKGRLTTLRDLQTQAEAEEPAAISEPLAPPLPDSNMLTPNHQDPSIRQLEERLSCYIASVEEVLTEASSRELHPPDESESGTEEGASDDVEPITKRRRGPDARSFPP